MNVLEEARLRKIINRSLLRYAQMYEEIEKETMTQISQFGLPFEQRPDQDLLVERKRILKEKGALFRNNDKSILSNEKISSACRACRTGTGSYTSFVSLKCHRDCYFCFNPNQDDYQFYLHHHKDATGELDNLLAKGAKLTHLALTGGEPLLHADEAVAFFEKATSLRPGIHTRLYTTGDMLTEKLAVRLRDAGLKEIRFSIKLEDSERKRMHILKQIALANKFIDDVLVEMPVIPGTGEEMKQLLLDLDELGIFGINLLEFCFPLGNAEAFAERGFKLKNPPYDVYYNFWYAGGMAVAESEALCQELVQFAIEQDLKLGVHYCSLENKFTGQVYQQNSGRKLGTEYKWSPEDFYYKTAKVFGHDKNPVKKVLKRERIHFVENEQFDYLQFSVDAIPLLEDIAEAIIISSNIVEEDSQGMMIREVHLELAGNGMLEERNERYGSSKNDA